MMSHEERERALVEMDQLVNAFYARAVMIGNHPFLEFAGVMRAYVKSCERAHADGIDFSECSGHSGEHLPIESIEITYLREKLGCIFGGRITATYAPQ